MVASSLRCFTIVFWKETSHHRLKFYRDELDVGQKSYNNFLVRMLVGSLQKTKIETNVLEHRNEGVISLLNVIQKKTSIR